MLLVATSVLRSKGSSLQTSEGNGVVFHVVKLKSLGGIPPLHALLGLLLLKQMPAKLWVCCCLATEPPRSRKCCCTGFIAATIEAVSSL